MSVAVNLSKRDLQRNIFLRRERKVEEVQQNRIKQLRFWIAILFAMPTGIGRITVREGG
nr:MAG TPA: hypothetical protein [Caudoviricetes sp.]